MALSVTLQLLSLLPLFFISILFLYKITKSKPKNKLNTPPGPPPLPIIGNLHQLSSLPHRSLLDLSKTYGPIIHLKLGSVPTLVISSPSLAEQLFKAHDHATCSRPPLTTFREYSFGGADVALAPYGASWRNMRRIFIAELLSPKLLPAFRSIREEETEKMVRSIRAHADEGTAVNISDHMMNLMKSTTVRVAFGERAEGSGFDEGSGFVSAIEEVPTILGGFFVGDFFPGFGWVDEISGRVRKLRRSARMFDAFYQHVIDQHLDGEKREGRQDDIIDCLIDLWREGQLTMSSIKGAIMNILLGGTDTTAATITWAMAELARKPTLMKKAQNEVRKVIAGKGKVEESDLPRLGYLKCIVKETLRLHPAAPLLVPRETIQNCCIHGFDIVPKTRVLVNVWAIGRDKEAWENPEEFDPDRFVNNSVDYRGQHFQFLPFGAGRRICPGLHFGIAGTELALANLLYAFDWELPPGMKEEEIDMREASGIGAHKRTPLLLVAINNVP